MGEIATLGRYAFRNWDTDNVPSPGTEHDPDKSEIRLFVDKVDELVESLAGNVALGTPSISQPTWAALSAITSTVVGQRAEVPTTDAGTHTDPVVGGTVANAGIYGWSASPAGWRWVQTNDVTALDARLDAAEEDIAGIESGTVILDRVAVAATPVEVLDETDSSTYQTLTGSGVTPGTAVTVGNSGGDLILTSAIAATVPLGVSIFRGSSRRTVSFKGKFTTIAGTVGTAGLLFGWTTTAPTLGGAAATLAADFKGWLYRTLGSFEFVQRDGSSAAASPPVIANTVGGGIIGANNAVPYNVGDDVELIVAWDDGSTGQWTILTNGHFAASGTVTNLPVNAYLFFGFRPSGTSGDVFHIMRAASAKPPLPYEKTIYIKSGASDGGDGNATTSPFSTRDAVVDVSRDMHRGKIRLILKDDASLRGSLRFRGIWNEITIKSVNGRGATILGSRFIASGAALWTQIGATGVWYVDRYWGGVLNPASTPGGLVDLTNTQACGLAGTATNNFKLYSRVAPDTSHLSLTAGQMCVHTASTYAGKMLVKPYGGADPNTIQWEQSQHDSCIKVDAPLGSAWNATRINIEGVQCYYAYIANIVADRSQIDWTNIGSYGCSVGNGIDANQCSGLLADATVQGCASDGVHMDGAILDGSSTALPQKLRLLRVQSKNFPTLNSTGDAFSNHYGHELEMIDCVGASAAKDGLSAIDVFRMSGGRFEDNVSSGVALNSQDGKTIVAKIDGGLIKANTRGLTVGNTSGNVTVDVQDVLFDTNVHSSINVGVAFTASSAAVVNRRGLRSAGATPSAGHIVTGGSGSAPLSTLTAIP